MIQLGQEVRDRITQQSGIVVAITEWLYGCRRIVIQPRVFDDKTGKPAENFVIDEPQCEVVGDGLKKAEPVMETTKRQHGVRDDRTAMERGGTDAARND